MIAEERLPTLGWRASPPGHILGHAGLSDFDAELEKLAMNRGAPQSGLAILISRISSRISSGTVGRPPRCLDFQRQYDLKPARCQRITVSGFKIARAPRILTAYVIQICLRGPNAAATLQPGMAYGAITMKIKILRHY